MKFDQFQTSSTTTRNMVCKRSQHVGPNNVAFCWPTMLRALARAFKHTHSIFGLLLPLWCFPTQDNDYFKVLPCLEKSLCDATNHSIYRDVESKN